MSLQRLLTTTIGLKIVIALTGVVLTVFVLGHMPGNLQMFQGVEAIDDYAKLLHKEPAILWTVRFVLLGAIGLHIWAYIVLTRSNQPRAGGVSEEERRVELRLASMRLTGPLLAAFIIFHILHLTTGTVHPDYHEGDVHSTWSAA